MQIAENRIKEILKFVYPPYSPSISTAETIIARSLGRKKFSIDEIKNLTVEEGERVLETVKKLPNSNAIAINKLIGARKTK